MKISDTFIKNIMDIAKEKPDSIAIKSMDGQMTYAQLTDEALRQSAILKKHGVNKNEIVAVVCDDKMQNIVNCIAVSLAGGVFLAVDKNIPVERFNLIREDSKLRFVISKTEKEWFKTLEIIDFNEEADCQDTDGDCGEDMYMLYTSGTTGIPKAVIIHYDAFKVFRKAINNVIEYDKSDVVFLATTSLTFDISILETLVTLSYGGEVVCVNDDKKMIPQFVKEVIQTNGVNTVQFTPTYMRFLMKHFDNDLSFMKDVKKMLIGGEIFTDDIKRCIKQLENTEVYNVYGPTEATIWATAQKVEDGRDVTIGYPLEGYKVYIDSEEEVGEICIKGEAVSKGYYNHEDLTRSKFFVLDGERVYRTGDLGKIGENGEIIFCGRKDRQVKIKGFRIELDEIESRISRLFPEIYKLAVIYGDEKLVCVYQTDEEISRKDIISKLRDYLPSYMIPMYYFKIDSFPLLINGKTDYKKLSSLYLEQS